MEKRSLWALAAAVFAASIVGCGLDTGPSDERVAGDGVLPPDTPPGESSSPGTPGNPNPGGGTNAPTPEAPAQPGTPAPTTPPTPGTKIVFVTSVRVSGSISYGGGGIDIGVGAFMGGNNNKSETKSGIEAADAICNEEAKSAKLAGTFTAWLSKEENNAINRIPENAGGWSLPTGHLVFPNRAHIAAGLGPQRQILVQANGWWVTGTADAWTSTSEKGIVTSSSCDGWEKSSGSAVTGSLYYTDRKWTNNTSDYCSSQRRLICFQK